MLTTIKEFLNSIANMFLSLWDFVIDFFEDIAYVVKLVTSFVVGIPDYFSWLPVEILSLIVAIFGVAIIYKVLGRE